MLSEKVEKLTKIEESQIRIIKNIGSGTFGEVFEGTLKLDDTSEIPVAIKVTKNTTFSFVYFVFVFILLRNY